MNSGIPFPFSSQVKQSAASLLDYLRRISTDHVKQQAFADTLLQVFQDHQKVDRVTLPMFKMLDQLLANNIFNLLMEEEG